MRFSSKDFFSKCEQIGRKLRIWSHLLKKSLMKNFIFCAVTVYFPAHFSNTTEYLTAYLNTTTHFLLTGYKHNVAYYFNMTVHFLHNTEHFLNRITVNFLNISAHFLNNTVDFLNSAAHFMTLIQLNLIFPKSININLDSFLRKLSR